MNPIGDIIIEVFSNGEVQVKGFPTDIRLTLDIFHKAQLAIIDYFLSSTIEKNKRRIITLNPN